MHLQRKLEVNKLPDGEIKRTQLSKKYKFSIQYGLQATYLDKN